MPLFVKGLKGLFSLLIHHIPRICKTICNLESDFILIISQSS